MFCPGTYPTIPLQGLHQGIVGVRVKVQALMHLLKVQIFERGRGLGALFTRGAALVGGALQIILVVHLHGTWQHIVHHHHTDGGAAALDAVKTIKLWQERPRVLIQILQ